jgi:hypothetical protein
VSGVRFIALDFGFENPNSYKKLGFGLYVISESSVYASVDTQKLMMASKYRYRATVPTSFKDFEFALNAAIGSVVDPHHFDVDPDADFLFDADPDPHPDPSFKKRLKPL